MFKDAWKLPAIQRKLKGEGAVGKKVANMTAAQKAQAREEQENTNLFLDMLQIMPHSTHARMIADNSGTAYLVWCTLNQDYLVVPASDIALTYGATMAGEWSIVGILSAHPEYSTPDLEGSNTDDFGVYESMVGQVSKTTRSDYAGSVRQASSGPRNYTSSDIPDRELGQSRI